MWSIASIILLIAGIAGMIWYHTAHAEEEDPKAPAKDPLINAIATPSMKATRKYFFVVIGLILVQIAMGAITAHYAVEGRAFFGLPLGEVLPYVVTPHDPHAVRDLLDRNRVACNRPLHRAAAVRDTSPSCRSSASTCCSGR